MSNEWLSEVVARRKEALERFSYSDPNATALNVSSLLKLNALEPTSAIIVTGFIPADCCRFSVNLVCKTSRNIGLHFNSRIDRGYVVRNTRIKGAWQEEETCSPIGSRGYIFRRNSFFHLLIFCTQHDFQFAIDGNHFCAFTYRVPLEEITGLQIDGDVDETKVRQTRLSIYPDPEIYKPERELQLTEENLLQDNLGLPVDIDLPHGFDVGSRIFIKGRLKLLPHSFFINLQKGKLIYPHAIIALHLNPRFLYGNSPSCVVINCWTNGKWDIEERHEGHLSWRPGREFLLTIRCDLESYSIWLGTKMICEFKHRCQPSIIDTLRITGDLVLHQLAISY